MRALHAARDAAAKPVGRPPRPPTHPHPHPHPHPPTHTHTRPPPPPPTHTHTTTPTHTPRRPPNRSLAGAPYSWPSAATVDWWRFVAARYKSQPHVFFGLLNEPQVCASWRGGEGSRQGPSSGLLGAFLSSNSPPLPPPLCSTTATEPGTRSTPPRCRCVHLEEAHRGTLLLPGAECCRRSTSGLPPHPLPDTTHRRHHAQATGRRVTGTCVTSNEVPLAHPPAALQPVVDAIRSTGATNLIAVGASRMWARFAEGFLTHPIVDTNWAAAVHFYLTPAETVAAYDKYCKVGGCEGRAASQWVGGHRQRGRHCATAACHPPPAHLPSLPPCRPADPRLHRRGVWAGDGVHSCRGECARSGHAAAAGLPPPCCPLLLTPPSRASSLLPRCSPSSRSRSSCSGACPLRAGSRMRTASHPCWSQPMLASVSALLLLLIAFVVAAAALAARAAAVRQACDRSLDSMPLPPSATPPWRRLLCQRTPAPYQRMGRRHAERHRLEQDVHFAGVGRCAEPCGRASRFPTPSPTRHPPPPSKPAPMPIILLCQRRHPWPLRRTPPASHDGHAAGRRWVGDAPAGQGIALPACSSTGSVQKHARYPPTHPPTLPCRTPPSPSSTPPATQPRCVGAAWGPRAISSCQRARCWPPPALAAAPCPLQLCATAATGLQQMPTSLLTYPPAQLLDCPLCHALCRCNLSG